MASGRRQPPRDLVGIADSPRLASGPDHPRSERAVSRGAAGLARRAADRPDLGREHGGDLEALVLEQANRFQDQIYAVAVAAIEHHPVDFAAAMRESLDRFLVELRGERLAYVALLTGDWSRGLHQSLKQVRDRKRQRLVELWAGYYERVGGLSRRDAEGLSSFQYAGLRGLVTEVDSGALAAETAITLFIDVLAAAADRLRGRIEQKPRPDRGGSHARLVHGIRSRNSY